MAPGLGLEAAPEGPLCIDQRYVVPMLVRVALLSGPGHGCALIGVGLQCDPLISIGRSPPIVPEQAVKGQGLQVASGAADDCDNKTQTQIYCDQAPDLSDVLNGQL